MPDEPDIDLTDVEAPDEEEPPQEPPAGEQVEFSEENESVEVPENEVAQFGQAVLWGTDWTVETIISQIERGNIEINPQFQRRDAWNRAAKSRFVESIILGLPIPQVVLAERRDQRGRYLILDGKQRLLSLMQFAGLATASRNNRFGLSGLEIRPDLSRKKYSHFQSRPELANEFDAFRSHTIRAVVIRNWPSMSFLHLVFHRLNSGSLKLSPQELRQALAVGPFTSYVDEVALDSHDIHRLLSRDTPDPRMRDTELLVRHLSFRYYLHHYTGRMKEFLDDSCDRFNQEWDVRQPEITQSVSDFKEAVAALEQIFAERRIARKRNSNLFNRSIFDALAYYASIPEIRATMLANHPAVCAAYEATIGDEQFQIAVESDTAGIPHTERRFRIWGQRLGAALELELPVPVAVENDQGQVRFTA